MNPGALVEYLQGKRLACAICLKRDNKDVLYLLTEDNREDKVAASKVVFHQPTTLSGEPAREQALSFLQTASRRRQEVAAEVPLDELYELLSEDAADSYELKELAELYFGASYQPEDLSGLYRALEADRIYFTRKGDRYQLRPRAQVEDILTRLRVEAEKEQNREQISGWLKKLWQRPEGSEPTGYPADFEEAARRYFTWIREVALFGTEASRFKEVQTLLKQAGISGKDAAFRLMLKAGHWSSDENLLLHKNRVSIDFASEMLELARSRSEDPAPLHDTARLDLRHLETFTIDDAETTEIDDALTLERLEHGGYRVGIHIADASAYVQPGSELDLLARDRGTAIYLPDLKVRMLPSPLSEHACSLMAGHDRPAFSFLAEFDASLKLVGKSMHPSLVRVRHRLTYQQAEAQLSAGADWQPMMAIAESLRAEREAGGAITVGFPRLNVRCVQGEVEIERESPSAPGQVLVSEMMILANRLAGEFLAERDVPAIYRSQPAPEQALNPEDFRDPVALFRLRRFLRKGEMGLDPARHAGLGLDAYLQVTSPIRRYGDLVLQRQLKAAVQGQTLYSREQMQEVLAQIQRTSETAEMLERDRRNYWVLRYLEARRGHELDALVLQNGPDRNLVQITEVLWETDCPHLPGRPFAAGERLFVRLELVWPREGVVRVSPVAPA